MRLLMFLSLLICYSDVDAQTQPQWKFYIAFEEGTGQKDTLWCIWDSLATSMGVDTIFGEQAIQLDYSKFNVYIFNQNSDTTKTSALDSLGSHQLLIEAINFQHPINITWDSTILHQYLPFLPTGFANFARIDNDYFFGVNNCPSCQQLDMWIDDHAFAPWYSWGSQSQFPMGIYILSDPSIGFEEHNDKSILSIHPNPAYDFIEVNSSEAIVSYKIYSVQGQVILKNVISIRSKEQIDLTDLCAGIYFIEAVTNSSHIKVNKFIKLPL